MKDIKERIEQAHSLYSSSTLQELLQRQVTAGRSKEISEYLQTQSQRFFNALVIGTYGGDPKWTELEIKTIAPTDYQIPENLDGTLGFLILEGSERLFTIDGQHRVEGIRLAVQQNPELENEEVCTIFVRGITGESRVNDPEGFERTRRLFTTLNRYAKPVNKKDIIALDEDDSIAIITRRLVEENPLFSEKTSIKGSTSIPVGDHTSFTSINALYDALDIYFKEGSGRKWNKFKRFYPGEEKIDELYEQAEELWDCLCTNFPSLSELRESEPVNEVAAIYRNTDGGHLLYRPIGLLMTLKVIRNLIDHRNLSLEQAVARVSTVTMALSEEPWANLIWNPIRHRMITASANRKAAEKILVYAAGGDLNVYRSSPDDLRTELAAILLKDINEINLPLVESR